MVLQKFSLVVGLTVALGMACNAAGAVTVPNDIELDFRKSEWGPSGGTSRSNANQGDFGTVTVTANPTGSQLYWDSTDGFGVQGGENDEIDREEYLTVEFENAIALDGFWFTDLFNGENDGPGNGVNEKARVTLFHDNTAYAGVLEFEGVDLLNGTLNGELFGDIGIHKHKLVDKIVFSSTGLAGDEFSVAGIEGYPVPLPGAFGFLLAGLGGLGVMARQRRRNSAAT
ncbi:MAG: VPLPA-CTERM sorting domain-containing protein [Rhodospirillaceae bacterium]|mgnify:FL=1|jgi:hypothetical protein|nr:VPLPA-CTERM sorting domain-containing protein [Rhodospirillaceae bacterium]MBT4690965.1 VPLPA-CTERM sorting domain-containing protein [Rhodospirillaceae bacterium]MBT5079981.1 VPLPA-CTERM sorting domain-containing protein [Rhodospirillaceae bacterium]MBT5526003.1 VPLPA-CTERM sorting domain-containing protein [Rhodospirillaceae bacterium]MBT5881792.1 VPLPA-CTERM sorting domain-containing protein [Rhodospirillaceae bacterium]